MTGRGEPGYCGFCGSGGGYLGEQGDEGTQHLHSAVRSGDTIEDWTYDVHPHAVPHESDGRPGQYIVWCGRCVSGLRHKYQRLSDHNLHVQHRIYELWLEMDAPHWSIWDAKPGDPERALLDDPSVHLEKVHREREVTDMLHELQRRAGYDLTRDDWRP